MKFAHARASRTAFAGKNQELETMETVSNASATFCSNRSPLRTLLTALTTVAFGLTVVAATAQDAPKPEMKTEKKMDTPAPAAPAGPAPGSVTVTGLIDGYFQVNYQHPGSKGKSTLAAPYAGVNATRAFDYQDGFGLSLGEINIVRTAGKGFPLGVTATLTAFDTPPVVYATEPGRKSGYEGIQQLYVTYTPHVLGRDVAIDFGKFVTPTGYEVIESSSNDNYSRGLLFTYGVPFYHTGFRFAAPISKKLAFTGGIVNGWNNTADDNEAKSVFTQLTWTPSTCFTGTFNFIGGSEGTGAYGTSVPTNGAGNITTNLFEFIPVFNPTSKLKLAGDLLYASGAGDVNGSHVSGNWFGVAAYVRYQATPQIAGALRIEQFEDQPGAGKLPGAGFGGLRFGAGYVKLNSFTATFEYAAFHGKLISRLEYRHDKSSQPFGAIGQDQDTLTLGEAYKF